MPPGHVAEGIQVVEAVCDPRCHLQKVVLLVDDDVGVVDDVILPLVYPDHEAGLSVELSDGFPYFLVLVRGAEECLRSDHLYFESGEGEVMNILYSVLQGASFAGQRDTGGSVSYHGQSLMAHQQGLKY